MRSDQTTAPASAAASDAISGAPQTPVAPLKPWERPGVRQLVKFCLVGASSTVIDQGTKAVLLTLGEKYAPGVPWWLWVSISFALAVTNGYFWNRKWTFQATSESHGSAQAQYHRFILTNAIGLGLNLAFTKMFLIAFTGQVSHPENPDKMHVILASLCAVPIVVIWNFSAAKFWTFKRVS
jgi:putative flippase GtrA